MINGNVCEQGRNKRYFALENKGEVMGKRNRLSSFSPAMEKQCIIPPFCRYVFKMPLICLLLANIRAESFTIRLRFRCTPDYTLFCPPFA